MIYKYEIRPFKMVNNKTCQFYEASVNGKYLYDKFYNNLKNETVDKKNINSIIAYMDFYSPYCKLPSTKFNHIQNSSIPNLYEFKKKDIRIYVILKEPSVFVVLGGYKGRQKQDIEQVVRLFKDFKI